MGGLGQDFHLFLSLSLPNKREHFNSCFHPSRLKTQFHDQLAARALFNNSQLCSEAPSPQREPTCCLNSSWLLRCVCSVTLISSMSMFPHLSRLRRCSFNNTACYCPGGSLLCVSCSSLFPPICYAVYPNMERLGPACSDARGRRAHKRTPNKRRESACIYQSDEKRFVLNKKMMFHSNHLHPR